MDTGDESMSDEPWVMTRPWRKTPVMDEAPIDPMEESEASE